MARAALDHRQIGAGDEAQHLGRLLAHVLGPGMAGDMQRHAAIDGLQPGCQALALGDVDDIFADVEGRLGELLDLVIAGQDQRPFELQHQGAGGHQGHDVIALLDPGQQGLGYRARALRHLGEIALLELRHAAAAGIDHLGLDAVQRQHGARRHADAGVVVVDEAGGVEHRLAPEGRGFAIDLGWCCFRLHGEGLAVEFRQGRVAMDVGDLLHQRAGQLVGALDGPIGDRRHGPAQLAVAVGLRQLAHHALGLAPRPLGKAVAQHEMGEIEIELMGRDVGAFGHEAEVAERAGLDDIGEGLALDVLQLLARRLVDEIEEAGKAVAEIEAAPAAMADVEDAAHLFIQLHRIGEVGIVPRHGMTGWRVEAAFSHGSDPSCGRSQPSPPAAAGKAAISLVTTARSRSDGSGQALNRGASA